LFIKTNESTAFLLIIQYKLCSATNPLAQLQFYLWGLYGLFSILPHMVIMCFIVTMSISDHFIISAILPDSLQLKYGLKWLNKCHISYNEQYTRNLTFQIVRNHLL